MKSLLAVAGGDVRFLNIARRRRSGERFPVAIV
jgi:hypothetical protein